MAFAARISRFADANALSRRVLRVFTDIQRARCVYLEQRRDRTPFQVARELGRRRPKTVTAPSTPLGVGGGSLLVSTVSLVPDVEEEL